ncbi:hypothetical protein [Pseudomonas ogarae]
MMLFLRAISLARLSSIPISFAASTMVRPVSTNARRFGFLVASIPQLVAARAADWAFFLTGDAGGDFLQRSLGPEELIQLLVEVRDDRVSRVSIGTPITAYRRGGDWPFLELNGEVHTVRQFAGMLA